MAMNRGNNHAISPKIGDNLILTSSMPLKKSVSSISYCAHFGPSMNPILCDKDLLEINIAGNISVGDVILFKNENDTLIVHRVISLAPEGIRTRGDNNNRDDPLLLPFEKVVGKVVAAWRGHKRRKIQGGPYGRLLAYFFRMRQSLYREAFRMLSIPYKVACRSSLFHKFMPLFQPKIVEFGIENFKLMVHSKMVGYYDNVQGYWIIHPPFKLFINEAKLPRMKTTKKKIQ